MDLELEQAHLQIMQARLAEDLFGAEDVVLAPARLLEYLEGKRAPLVRVVTMDGYLGEEREAALEAQTRLDTLWADAQSRVQKHLYGLPGCGSARLLNFSKSFRVGENTYHLGHKLEEEVGVGTYQGYLSRDGIHLGEVMFKLATSLEHNRSIEKEGRLIDLLHAAEAPQWKHLPIVLDRFQAQGRSGLVLRMISGHSLAWLKNRPQHCHGLDQRDVIWMLDRLLSCLGYMHRCGIVHGCIIPERVVIQHLSHNVILSGWGDAVHRPAVTGEYVEKTFEPFSAPEVLDHGELGPWSDIYSVGKLIIWLLGGNPERNEIPQGVVTPLKNFLLRMVQEDKNARPADAWALWDEENRIKDAHWERKFRALDVS